MANNPTAANKAAEEGGLFVTPWEDRTSLYHSEHLSQIERMDQEIKDWRDLHLSARPLYRNKEGERDLPALPEEIEVGGEGWDFEDFKSQKTFSVDHMHEYARHAIAADRASRQVANKAEVEPVLGTWPKRIWLQAGDTDTRDDYQTVRHLGDGITWADNEIDRFDVEYVRADLATPPATTGASTAPATIVVKAGNAFIAPPGTKVIHEKDQVGASTVLTDERIDETITMKRIDYLADRDACFQRGKEQGQKLVAAQAGQVAVPEGFAIVPLEPTDAMKKAAVEDAPLVIKEYWDSKFTGTVTSLNTEMFGQMYKQMLAAAPSPAKESK